MKKIITSFVLALCFVFIGIFSGCVGSASVESISITKSPQTEYIVGDELSLEGGELTATYTDGTTEVVLLTDSAVTVQRPNMNTTGTKTVSVTYKSRSTTYSITVSEAQIDVTFDLNYTGSTSIVVSVDPNTTVTPPDDPERDGYVFLGWYIESGTSSRYNFDVAITSAVTVYAHWGYSVEFNLNYEDSESTIQSVEVGSTVSRPNNPEREGYIFAGWYTDAECTTEYNFGTVITANTVIYAGWRYVGDAEVFTVTFVLNDGAGSTIVSQVVEGETVARPEDPELAGSTFAGWYADEDLTEEFDFSVAITADTYVYAQWYAEYYTIVFMYNHDNNDGIYYSTTIMDLEGGYPVSAPDDPVMDGYYFAGWYEEEECTTKATFPVDLRENHYYYAKWLREWEFQAEDTNFDGKEAFGYSANGTGATAFIMSNNAEAVGAHNGYWVSNLHSQGLTVEFEITSSEEVFDAVLVLRLSADFYDIILNSSNFGITINGETIDYDFEAVISGAISPEDGGITNKRPFDNWTFLTDMHLVEGNNTIVFTILDDQKYGTVGTINATAPIMDCIHIMTNATLSWTAPYPYTSNYS